MGGITALGDSWEAIEPRLRERKNAVRTMPEWNDYLDLQTRLGAPIDHFEAPTHYPRRMIRSMGRVAMLGVRATELALEDAGLREDPILKSGEVGIAYGSSYGSLEPMLALGRGLATNCFRGITATGYIQAMSHTAAVNIGVFFSIKGRIIATSTACTSGSQAIGYAYEAIRFGRQTVMVAGGSDELTFCSAAVFDTLYATSLKNDDPKRTPRPFDRDREGLVLGEGGCTFILEEREHALARGAHIYAEVLGFGTNSDGAHVTLPQMETMAVTMELAIQDAGISKDSIGWVNAHGTATGPGDVAESQATRETFGRSLPISSLKSYFGHTLGACGSMEAWLGIQMLRTGWVAPTINLDNLDPKCADLDYITGEGRNLDADCFMTNNFAFGGINTSLIFKVEK
jgi:3-oxoacyl-[acyl-carrier-protein] synthase II